MGGNRFACHPSLQIVLPILSRKMSFPWRRVWATIRPRPALMSVYLTQVIRLLSIETRNKVASSKSIGPVPPLWTLHLERQKARHMSFPPVLLGFAAGFSAMQGSANSKAGFHARY
jgi:hypothetical protein